MKVSFDNGLPKMQERNAKQGSVALQSSTNTWDQQSVRSAPSAVHLPSGAGIRPKPIVNQAAQQGPGSSKSLPASSPEVDIVYETPGTLLRKQTPRESMALQDRRSPPSSPEVEILYETPKTPKAVHKSVSEYVEMKRIPTDLISNRGVRESFAGTVKRRTVTDTSGTADNSAARPPSAAGSSGPRLSHQQPEQRELPLLPLPRTRSTGSQTSESSNPPVSVVNLKDKRTKATDKKGIVAAWDK